MPKKIIFVRFPNNVNYFGFVNSKSTKKNNYHKKIPIFAC